MKRTTTLIKVFLAFVLLLGNIIVNAQLNELWNKDNTYYTWNTSTDYRGIAYNPNNNHLYVAGTPGSSTNANNPDMNYIQILDASNGELLKTLTLDTITLEGNGFGIRDVAVSDDGGIFAMTATLNTYNLLKIFYWASEDDKAQIYWSYPSPAAVESQDFSTGFSIKGDITKDALILIPRHDAAAIWYLEIKDGVLDVQKKELTLTGITAGASASAEALGTSITDGFWYNNASLQEPTLIDGTGNIIGAIDGALFTGTTGDIKVFSHQAKNYLVVSNAGNIQLIDVTGKSADYSDVAASDFTEIAGIDAPHPTAWGYQAYGYGQEQAIAAYPFDNAFQIFSLSGSNYIKAVASEAAPFATDLMLTGFAMVDSLAQVSYTYVDINNDEADQTLYKWFVSDDDQGTNKVEFSTESQITVPYAYMDKYLSYSVLAVAKTGTLSDENNWVESAYYGPVTSSAQKPEATDLALSGAPEVYGLLTASYTFTDADGDNEAGSILKWWRADDAAGLNAIEVAADTLKYMPLPADENKFILFSVIPVSDSPNFAEGDSVAVASALVTFPAYVPVASNVAISGLEEVSRILTGSYTYSDLNEDEEGASVLTWYSADAADGAKTTVASDTNRYELVTADEGKYIFFGVKPLTVDAEEGIEVFDTTGVIAPKPEESAPIASNVLVSGNPEVGALLSATYTYSDYTDDPEGETIFKWYTADDAAGTNKTLIDGANMQTLLVAEAQLGKFIVFEVTPVAQTGGLLEGTPVADTTLVATVASTQTFGLERVWIASEKTGTLPFYLGTGSSERGMAAGISGDHMYVASRKNGSEILVLNKADGALVGKLDMTGVSGGLFSINDIEVSDDGQILAAPLSVDGAFWIYKWSDEMAAPVKWIEYNAGEALRLGDRITVVGDLSGDAIITVVPQGTTSKIIRWIVTGGVPAEADYINLEVPLSGTLNPSAVPFSASADANILLEVKGLAPTIYDKDGKVLSTIDNVDNYGGTVNGVQSAVTKLFTHKGRSMAAILQAVRKGDQGARVLIVDITNQPYQIVDSTELISTKDIAAGYLGDLAVEANDEEFVVYMMETNYAIASWKGKLELPEYVSSITSWEGDKLFVEFTKNLNVESVTPTTANWTVIADGEIVEISALGAEEKIVTITMSASIAKGKAITLAYDGMGSVASFDGMPLSAFGPVDVESIIGVEAPVASNVDFTGDLSVGATVTGEYTYTDSENDVEGASKYQWYYASDASGTDMLKIIGETGITYTVTQDISEKYIAFEVTPVAETGGADYLVGTPVMTTFKLITEITDNLASLISLYPNPVNDQLTLTGTENVTSVMVFDYTGRVIIAMDNVAQTVITLNVSNLNAGVYMIQVTDTNGQFAVKRIVKQ
jgi:WD40 repeat protein